LEITHILSDQSQALNAMVQDVISETEKILKISRINANKEIAAMNGKHLNFFLWVRAEYCKKLQAIHPRPKNYQAAKNDQGDLLNMVYVGNNDKYWVEEPKWKNNISDAGLSNFMFELEVAHPMS
jgi:hypothetical protein